MKTWEVKIEYPKSRFEIEAKTKEEATRKAWEQFNDNYDCYPDEFEPYVKSIKLV